jgi:argininosuccinate lyase
MDAVSDRDFVVEVLAAVALTMVHLSRFAEEITWWSNPAFGFVRVADAFSTGSSIMPNKRNPDPAELVRGRASRTVGNLVAMLGLLKGLPLAYQRDLQEDKPLLFEAVAILDASLGVMAGLVGTLAVDTARMRAAADEGFTTATAVADALVGRGVAFRSAHQVVGALVAAVEVRDARLDEIEDAEIAAALRASDDEVARALAAQPGTGEAVRRSASVDAALAATDVIGGTAPARVSAALAAARGRLGKA